MKRLNSIFRVVVVSLLICVSSGNVTAQDYGNSFYLKYGFTENDLVKDVELFGMLVTHSLSKPFLLKHLSSYNFSTPTAINPSLSMATANVGESAGEKLSFTYPSLQTGLSFGTNLMTPNKKQGFVAWSHSQKNVGFFKDVRMTATVAAKDQDYRFEEKSNSLVTRSKGVNANIVLQNNAFSKRNSFVFRSSLITDQTSNRWGGLNNTVTQLDGQSGYVSISSLSYTRKLSANHFLTLSGQSEIFEGTDTFQSSSNQKTFNRLLLKIKDEMRFKKARIINEIHFAQNKTEIKHFEMNQNMNHDVLLWVASYLRKNPSKNYGFSYHHQLGNQSNEGMVYNPAFRFFQRFNTVLYDVGFRQTSRTPSLYSEFQSFQLQTPLSILGTLSQEVYRKAFISVKRGTNYGPTMELKFQYNQSPNKWLFSDELNKLHQTELRYSQLFIKYTRRFTQRHNLNLTYQFTLGETNSADILPAHWVHGTYKYESNERSIRIKKKYKTFNVDFRSDFGYLSEYKLPFSDVNVQATSKEGLYLDLYAIWVFNKQYRYKSKGNSKLQSISVTTGVSNVFNSGTNSLPFTTNAIRPTLPRQLFLGLKANLF